MSKKAGTIVETPCFACMNLIRYPAKCLAYPNGIPDPIRQGADDHTKARGDEAEGPDGKPYKFAPFGAKG